MAVSGVVGRRKAAKRKTKFGSPIETMLHNGIVESARSHRLTISDLSVFAIDTRLTHDEEGLILVEIADAHIPRPLSDVWGDVRDFDRAWSLYGGVSVRSYKIDFVLSMTSGVLAIECDGHEWHDRTKQQAAYDRARDRELLSLGIPTVRFTGSEIHHDIDRCVADIVAVASHLEDTGVGLDARWNEGFNDGWTAGLVSSPNELLEEHW